MSSAILQLDKRIYWVGLVCQEREKWSGVRPYPWVAPADEVAFIANEFISGILLNELREKKLSFLCESTLNVVAPLRSWGFSVLCTRKQTAISLFPSTLSWHCYQKSSPNMTNISSIIFGGLLICSSASEYFAQCTHAAVRVCSASICLI